MSDELLVLDKIQRVGEARHPAVQVIRSTRERFGFDAPGGYLLLAELEKGT